MLYAEEFINAVGKTLKPTGRAKAAESTLAQIIPMLAGTSIELEDLRRGWEANGIAEADEANTPDGPIKSRQITCRELAEIAGLYTAGEGDIDQAVAAWTIWKNQTAELATTETDERAKGRLEAMAATFARELKELGHRRVV